MNDEARCAVTPVCPKCYAVPIVVLRSADWQGLRCLSCGWHGETRTSMPLVPEGPIIVPTLTEAALVQQMAAMKKLIDAHVALLNQRIDGIPRMPFVTPGPGKHPTEPPQMFTYDEVLKALCPYCLCGLPVHYDVTVDSRWKHRETVQEVPCAFTYIRECAANDWRRSHPR